MARSASNPGSSLDRNSHQYNERLAMFLRQEHLWFIQQPNITTNAIAVLQMSPPIAQAETEKNIHNFRVFYLLLYLSF